MAPFQLLIDPILLRKHAGDGPRYPRYDSYPTCDFFVEAFGERDVRDRIAAAAAGGSNSQALSVYLHLPFCEASCRYCGCRKIVARQRERVQRYVKSLEREIRLASELAGEQRRAMRFHWRCAIPDAVSAEEIASVTRAVRGGFHMEPDAAWVIDVEARRVLPGRVSALAALGFNELCILTHDADAGSRQAVSAKESLERCVQEARGSGFRATHVDFVYGTPRQTLDRFQGLLEHSIAQAPDRIALQRHSDPPIAGRCNPRGAADQPEKERAAQMLSLGAGMLVNAGYQYIGTGNFVKPESSLAMAKIQGRLRFGPDGYAVLPDADVFGFGVSSIGRLGSSYWQNLRGLDEYCASLDAGRLPVWRGLELSSDDLVRRAVIHALICNFRVSMEAIERGHLIDFRRYFARELEHLETFAEEGLVELEPDWVVVTPQGKLLVQAICEAFDRQRGAPRRRIAHTRI